MLKANDIVITHYGEKGVIVKPFSDSSYDWWVDITFYCPKKEKHFTCREPYKNSELKKLTSENLGVE